MLDGQLRKKDQCGELLGGFTGGLEGSGMMIPAAIAIYDPTIKKGDRILAQFWPCGSVFVRIKKPTSKLKIPEKITLFPIFDIPEDCSCRITCFGFTCCCFCLCLSFCFDIYCSLSFYILYLFEPGRINFKNNNS